MAEPNIKYNQREAARLFERGVAAARGGQRRVAASLLARAVQFDPRHEQAWLWLSGTLDDPNEIAFCLRSVLSINPHNERARQGLAWLEQRQMIAPHPPAEVAPAPAIAEDDAARGSDESSDDRRTSWWVSWRRSRQEMSKARLLVWMVPIVLLALTLGLNVILRNAIERNTALVRAATAVEPTAVRPVPTPTATPEPILHERLALDEQAQALAYISQLAEPREQLRAAVDAYREATNQPGNSSGVHATAARRFRDAVEDAYTAIAELDPPPSLETAHASYLSGLEQELAAIDDMLEFYGTFSIKYANRAALRMEDADKRISQARQLFALSEARANLDRPSAQTPR